MARSYGERHHILHHRTAHESNKDNHWLRTKAIGMIALLDPDVHDELHKACPGVPPLDLFTAQRVRRLYIADQNPLKAIDNYMFAVDLASQHPKSHDIEVQLSQLAIQAVEMQKPFIKEGLILPL